MIHLSNLDECKINSSNTICPTVHISLANSNKLENKLKLVCYCKHEDFALETKHIKTDRNNNMIEMNSE